MRILIMRKTLGIVYPKLNSNESKRKVHGEEGECTKRDRRQSNTQQTNNSRD